MTTIHLIEVVDGTIRVTTTCPSCGKTYSIEIPQEDSQSFIAYAKEEQHRLIQNVIPHADATICESLISGFCKECQDDFFGNMNDEKEEH